MIFSLFSLWLSLFKSDFFTFFTFTFAFEKLKNPFSTLPEKVSKWKKWKAKAIIFPVPMYGCGCGFWVSNPHPHPIHTKHSFNLTRRPRYSYRRQTQHRCDLRDLAKDTGLEGEPHFQPQFVECVSYRKVKGFRDISSRWFKNNPASTHRLMQFIHRWDSTANAAT